MEKTEHSTEHFSMAEARAIVADLFRPNPWIYWTDFLLSTTVGALAFWSIRRWNILLGTGPALTWVLGVCAYVTSVLLFYRAASFIHEIVHLPRTEFQTFRVAWNVFFGIPAMTPSFTYYTHRAHHVRRLYATESDGEYLALASGPRWRIFAFLLESLVAPLLIIARFLFLTPLAYVSPAVRRFVNRKLSSLVIDPNFVRPQPSQQEWNAWKVQELATVATGWVVAVLWWTGYKGLFPTLFLPQLYVVAASVLLLNSMRTLVAHRYLYPRVEVSFLDQLTDSINFPNHLWGASLWAPVGMRYHALHHLFPTLPYHNLAKAHARLMASLPADSPYRRTECPTMAAALGELWARAGKNGKAIAVAHSERPAANQPNSKQAA